MDNRKTATEDCVANLRSCVDNEKSRERISAYIRKRGGQATV